MKSIYILYLDEIKYYYFNFHYPMVCLCLIKANRVDSRFAPSQWETALLCKDVSHWLGTILEPALGKELHHAHGISIMINHWYRSIYLCLAYSSWKGAVTPNNYLLTPAPHLPGHTEPLSQSALPEADMCGTSVALIKQDRIREAHWLWINSSLPEPYIELVVLNILTPDCPEL